MRALLVAAVTWFAFGLPTIAEELLSGNAFAASPLADADVGPLVQDYLNPGFAIGVPLGQIDILDSNWTTTTPLQLSDSYFRGIVQPLANGGLLVLNEVKLPALEATRKFGFEGVLRTMSIELSKAPDPNVKLATNGGAREAIFTAADATVTSTVKNVPVSSGGDEYRKVSVLFTLTNYLAGKAIRGVDTDSEPWKARAILKYDEFTSGWTVVALDQAPLQSQFSTANAE